MALYIEFFNYYYLLSPFFFLEIVTPAAHHIFSHSFLFISLNQFSSLCSHIKSVKNAIEHFCGGGKKDLQPRSFYVKQIHRITNCTERIKYLS